MLKLQVSQMWKEKKENIARLKEIQNQIVASDGKMTDAQNEAWQASKLKIDELTTSINRINDLIDLERTIEALPPEDADALVSQLNPASAPKTPNLFASLGEQLQAIADAPLKGYTDPRLNQINAAITGAGTAPLQDGGYLIQTQFAQEIFQIAMETAQLAPRCTRLQIGAGFNAIEIPMIRDTNRVDGSRWGGVRVYRAQEAGTVTSTNIKIDKTRVEASKLMALSYMTSELLRDAPALESLTKQAVTEEFAVTLDEEIFTGNGGGGTCIGFMNSGSLISVSKETGQAAATIVPQNVVKMYNRCFARWRANAVWLYNQDIEPQLHLMTLPVGTAGVPVFLPPAGLTAAPNGMLYGKPLVAVETAETLGTAGDLVLADLSQYFLVEKQGLQTASSMHVRFLNDEMVFRWTMEVNGQPKYNEVITPKKGSNTYSAFVALATRS